METFQYFQPAVCGNKQRNKMFPWVLITETTSARPMKWKGDGKLNCFSSCNPQGGSQWNCPKSRVSTNVKNFSHPTLITLGNFLTQDVVEAMGGSNWDQQIWWRRPIRGNYDIPDVPSSSGSPWATEEFLYFLCFLKFFLDCLLLLEEG